MPPERRTWTLVGFLQRLDEWIEVEDADADLRLVVTNWIFTRFADPYRGVIRVAGFPNLWYGRVPGTQHGDRQVVVCSYWIEETVRSVRCDRFATLGLPI